MQFIVENIFEKYLLSVIYDWLYTIYVRACSPENAPLSRMWFRDV